MNTTKTIEAMTYVIASLGLLLPLSAFAQQVIGITDGDTLTVLVDKKPLKIRLANIDAPEKSQAFGVRSKQSLSDLCFGKGAIFKTQDIDRYGRTVAIVMCAGVDASYHQVARGMAWVYLRYNRNDSLPAVEATARTERRGLWHDEDPLPPWEFRRRKRGG